MRAARHTVERSAGDADADADEGASPQFDRERGSLAFAGLPLKGVDRIREHRRTACFGSISGSSFLAALMLSVDAKASQA